MIKIPKNTKRPTWIDENLPPELATSSLFKFKVKLQASIIDPETEKSKRLEIEVDVLPDLDIDGDILETQMRDVPAQYAFWSTVYSELRLGVAVAERKLKARKAEVTNIIVKEAKENSIKLTDTMAKTIVESDERLNAAELNYQHAQMQAGKLYHMLEALKMKAEISRSLLSLKKQDRANG